MSRCFPYPPPGFEPKLKNEHVDLLHKEKHKEKKHKKEKKDKDKREGKEKREKEKHHSKDKDKEKREKKEKHKHKKREKERDKEREKKTPEDSRILNEHSRRVGEGSHAGPGSQFTERRVAGNSSYGASSEKRPVPVPVQQSVNEAVKVGPTRTVPSASNPNSLVQRKSNNGPPTNQVLNNHHATGFTERRVAGAAEAKKPVPSSLNPSLQGKTNGPVQNRVAGTDAKRVVGNSKPAAQFTNNHHAAGLTERRVGLNQNVGPASALEKEKGGLNWRGSEPGEGKKEKRKERDEKKELRRQEKKQRKEREKQEKEKKKEKEKEREKVKEEREVGISMMRPSVEGSQRNIEKVGGTDAILSKKRKEGESNGFLHEDEMRAQKLVRTSPPDTVKRKDAFTNGILHENDVGSTKLTKKLPPHPPPPLENGRNSHHPPPVKPSSSSPSTAAINGTTVKAEVPLIKKAPPQLNGTNPDAKVHHKKKRKEEPPPHPDLKHLDVVYSVPKLSEKELTMPPFDEQEWLFGTKPNQIPNPNSKMREPGSSDGMSQVWDRALRLDSADNSFALPYVVPF